MSLTNIKLPGFVIADLYRNSLIQPSASDFEGVPQAMPQNYLPQQEAPVVAEPEPQPVIEAKPVIKTPVAEPLIEKTPPKQAALPPYKILGNNKKQIVVVVNYPGDVFVPESDLLFLTKMLDACKLNMADVAIVNHATAAVQIDRLKIQLQPKFLLLFGVEPDIIQLPINFPSYKEQPYAGTTYLFTPALSDLNQETDQAKGLKRKLWDCLKRMFL
ncbi:hypothetical protein A3860_16745 [Niastella vici]|uniref:Uncharacterized protein n=1 Tax=Niastella vici TaxID=1703345 RepID=A0A1V9G4D4_9BACT|nr:hypothetical protein [Niastella vici]OQP65316.1 hypothetical protein A3860_16745 [Niastella vici]